MEVQATLWHKQGRLGEARSAALRAADVHKKLGVAQGLERCRDILRGIEGEMIESNDDDGGLFGWDNVDCCTHQRFTFR